MHLRCLPAKIVLRGHARTLPSCNNLRRCQATDRGGAVVSKAVQTKTPAETACRQQSRIQQQEATAWPALDLPRLHAQSPSVRLRQHVNPFTPSLQVPVPPLDWPEIYADAHRPLVVDVGCGPGRFPLALAAKLPGHNILGIDIRGKLMERANTWARLSGCQGTVHFCLANATVSLQSMLSSYPGPIQLVTIQFPDPHWKMRNRKKRIVQPQLVTAVANILAPQGKVFLQSDVREVAVSMRDEFEYHGQGAFRLASEHSQQNAVFHTDQMTAEALPKDGIERQAWKSTWQESGWLHKNPLGVPTEREVHTADVSGSVYRVLLAKATSEITNEPVHFM